MAKRMVKIASIITLAVITFTLISTIAMAESAAAAKMGNYRCSKWICRAYESNGRRSGKWIPFGTLIRAQRVNNAWIKFHVNSQVYVYYYRTVDFKLEK